MQDGSRRSSRSGAPPECRPKRAVIPEGSQIEVRPRWGRDLMGVGISGGVRYAQTTGYRLGPLRGPWAAGAVVLSEKDPEGMQDGSRRLSRSGAPPECYVPNAR